MIVLPGGLGGVTSCRNCPAALDALRFAWDNGKFVANEPKNKSVRRAICERKGEIFMVESLTKESFHDFTQALVDLGVDNAVNLAGSEAYGWAIDRNGDKHEFGTPNFYTGRGKMPKNTNYIVWRVVNEQ